MRGIAFAPREQPAVLLVRLLHANVSRMMNNYQRVVVALSRSDHDRQLVKYARMLARMGIGRQFRFVHVRTPAQAVDEESEDAQIHRECQDLVWREFGEPRPNLEASCHVLSGVRIDRLIEFTTRTRSDLVLLGHRQSRSGQRSLARRMAMIAPCSVWMVPDGAPMAVSRIAAPIDFSDNSADSLEVATAIAEAAGVPECLAMHVFFDESTVRYDEHVDEVRRDEKRAFANFIEAIDTRGIRVEPCFVEGSNVARTLMRSIEQHQADLIVMNTRGRSRAASILLGSVTSQVMIETKVAILAVKHFGAMMNLFDALRESGFWDRPNPKTN